MQGKIQNAPVGGRRRLVRKGTEDRNIPQSRGWTQSLTGAARLLMYLVVAGMYEASTAVLRTFLSGRPSQGVQIGPRTGQPPRSQMVYQGLYLLQNAVTVSNFIDDRLIVFYNTLSATFTI